MHAKLLLWCIPISKKIKKQQQQKEIRLFESKEQEEETFYD